MELASLAKRRYTTKAFDASRKIPQASIDALLEQLRHSPSSVNSQPWHFVIASTDEGKARIAKGTELCLQRTQGPQGFACDRVVQP